MRTCVGEKSSYSQADNHNEKHKETSEASITSSSSSSFSACGLSAEEKLRLLREEMKKSAVDTYIIYTCDMHNSEITCEYDCRRAFISNFTGSAGVAVVTLKEALLWTDGRYASQAPLQLSATAGWILMKSWLKETPDVSTWIETQNHLHSVGIDAYRTPVAEYAKLTKLKKKNKKVKLLEENLVDKIWTEVYNRPPFPMNDIYIHPLHRCGMHTQKKIAMCREAMQKQDTQAILFSSLDDVAWMLNLRGSDIPFSPLFFAFFILTNQSAILYTQEKKINENVRKYLEENKILLKEYDSIAEDIGPLAASEKITKWWLDRFVSCGLYDLVFRQTRNVHLQNEQNEKEKKEKKSENGKEEEEKKEEEKKEEEKKEEEMLLDSFLETKTNPFVLLRATPAHMAKSKKNDVEIEGMREAHIKDGLALTQFLHWIHKRLESGEIEKETECTFADKLDFFRAQQEDFVSLSFPSISAFGQNGAIIHYKADKKECLGIKANGMYLFDSGSHYSHGTTDVTRTIFLPLNELHSPTPFQKKAFTLVLKGNMGIATAVFPENTSGVLLDVLARRSLWESGLDYRHGTGHGVGYCLNVHEGPHGITPNANCAAAHVPLESGMIVSNEPGFYLQDNFGIRIENLLLVREANFSSTFENVKFYKFEDLTLVPLQSCLIDKTLLTEQEVQWVNDYNRRVYEILSKRFEEEQKKKNVDYTEVIDFLKNYTKPI